MPHTREEVLSFLQQSEVAAVATASGDRIRSRMMHFAVDEEFNIYAATMKGDPKTLQMTNTPSVSLLVHQPGADINVSQEAEVTGTAYFVREPKERQRALEMTARKSPVVNHLLATGNSGVLDCINIVPDTVKFRVFGEIIQGMPPTVLEFSPARAAVNEWALLKKKLVNWWRETRPDFLTASLVPVMLGGAIALGESGRLSWQYFLLTLLAGVLLHGGANIINDYFDHKSGNDEINKEFVRPFTGGSRLIQLGILTSTEVLGLALFCFTAASLLGIYLAWARGPLILVLGLIGIISGFFYTGNPVNWARRGVGELMVGLNFGPLMVLGAYYVQTQSFSWLPIIAGLPVGFLIALVLYINEFPDFAADKAVRKNTWVVRLGRERAVALYVILVAATLFSLVAGVASGFLPTIALLALIPLLLLVRAALLARRYHSSSFELVPANALTVIAHFTTGLGLALAFVWQAVQPQNGYAAAVGVAFLAYVLYMYWNVEKQKRMSQGLKEAVKRGS